ncbi:glycine cleavage system protein GcvH [Candidatus Calescamantes bacterium]|nr:glycine cleavage system protein GcvH [Candidatus Calescamantes bacterium]
MKFTKSHEWIKEIGDVYHVGVSNYAQEHLSDIVYVEAESEGSSIDKGERIGTLESVKAAEDFAAPVDVEIVAFNDALADQPELINTDPENEGWIVTVKVLNETQLDELMDEAAYKDFLSTL